MDEADDFGKLNIPPFKPQNYQTDVDTETTIVSTIAEEEERHEIFLKELKSYEREIVHLTEKYNNLGTQLNNVNPWHRNIVQLAYELIDDTKGAIEMRRIGLKSEEELTDHHSLEVPRSGTVLKHSKIVLTRRDMTQKEHETVDNKPHKSLKSLYVSLNRIPQSVLKDHITNRSMTFDGSFVTNPISPEYSSTPIDLKTRTLREIYGLTPVQELRNSKPQPSPPYVNTRRRTLLKYSVKSEASIYEKTTEESYNTPPSSRISKPIQTAEQKKTKEKRSLLQTSSSPVKKMKTDVMSPPMRPRRQARPQNLKESSLRKKMRRN